MKPLKFTCCSKSRQRPKLKLSHSTVATLWNTLLNNIKSSENITTFHHQLKAYLFNLAYLP